MNNAASEFVLEARGLTKRFTEGPQELEILHGIDMTVARGEFVAIVGSSGSGKTTLMHLLGGLDAPTSGEVHLCGQDFSRSSETQRGLLRNRHIGFVYQFHHLLPEFTALENVCMPLLLSEASLGAVKPGKNGQALSTGTVSGNNSASALKSKPWWIGPVLGLSFFISLYRYNPALAWLALLFVGALLVVLLVGLGLYGVVGSIVTYVRGRKEVAEATQRAMVMLKAVGLEHRMQHKPSELSGGERQRVALARALVTEPAVVLADEPTGNLDNTTSQEVQALLAKLNRELGISFVIVTHDAGLAGSAQRILRMDHGRLSESSRG